MRLALALLAATLAGEAAADACYARDYSDAHMAKNPDQLVRQMRLLLVEQPYRTAVVEVLFRDDMTSWSNSMSCFDPTGDVAPDAFLGCAVDCDGGAFYLRRTREPGVLMETEGFIVSGGCGADDDEIRNVLDKGADRTVFKLFLTDLAACE